MVPARLRLGFGTGLVTVAGSGYFGAVSAIEETQTKAKGGIANLRPWQPGQSGNPAGRPKGARSKLGEAFVDALLADWNANGVKAIIDMRQDRPGDYVKVIASILPKELSGPDGEAIPVTALSIASLSEATLREIAGATTK